MKKITAFLIHHAKMTLSVGVLILIAAGIYGVGLFNELKSSDTIFANNTPSQSVNTKVEEIFGKTNDENIIILFERKDGVTTGVDSPEAGAEISSVLSHLDTNSVTSYYTTGQTAFLSHDKSATYALVTMNGDKSTHYTQVKKFASSAKSSMFNISVGGSLVGREQTQEQVKEDLKRAELVSLPILAILLFLFFRSPIAALLPLVMSILTILGGLAVSRFIQVFVDVDTYTLNIITILGVGLSIDYCLLAVNRFREELAAGEDTKTAAITTARTAGRTILFSGITVMLCLLSLSLFPVNFMHSISIGGTAAVIVAILISTFLLPPALYLVGHKIDLWHVGRKQTKSTRNTWGAVAAFVTKRPWLAIISGSIIIAIATIPLASFRTAAFDWRVLPSNQSAYHVGRVLDESFVTEVSTVTVLSEFQTQPKPSDICRVQAELKQVENVKALDAAYGSLVASGITCDKLDATLAGLKIANPTQYVALTANASKYTKDNFARYGVVSKYAATDSQTFNLVSTLRTKTINGVTLWVTGTSALSKDTIDTYIKWLPIVGGLIAVAMIIVLGLLLGSVLLPFQAIIINSLSLLIALGLLVGVFQFGWGQAALDTVVVDGFDPSIPILMVVMAFGLSMDYAVFLYSRIHEIYDQTGNVRQSIIDGVAKTGPIITAAAILMFVVIGALAFSHVVLIQQIGIGLASAVLVDAFFVRIFFVPAVMQLFGKASWWGPAWLKKITIKHE